MQIMSLNSESENWKRASSLSEKTHFLQIIDDWE